MELPLIIPGELPTAVEQGNHSGFNNASGDEFMEAPEDAYAFTASVTQEEFASWAIDTQGIGTLAQTTSQTQHLTSSNPQASSVNEMVSRSGYCLLPIAQVLTGWEILWNQNYQTLSFEQPLSSIDSFAEPFDGGFSSGGHSSFYMDIDMHSDFFGPSLMNSYTDRSLTYDDCRFSNLSPADLDFLDQFSNGVSPSSTSTPATNSSLFGQSPTIPSLNDPPRRHSHERRVSDTIQQTDLSLSGIPGPYPLHGVPGNSNFHDDLTLSSSISTGRDLEQNSLDSDRPTVDDLLQRQMLDTQKISGTACIKCWAAKHKVSGTTISTN